MQPCLVGVGCCIPVTGPQGPFRQNTVSPAAAYDSSGYCVTLGSRRPLWLMVYVFTARLIALPGPWERGCPRGPGLHSQAGVKSSGKALKGKCFSDVGPEIALPFPKLISSCLDRRFYFRNKRLLVLFTFQQDSRSALCLCSSKELSSGRGPRGPRQVSSRGRLTGEREGNKKPPARPVVKCTPFSGSTTVAHRDTDSSNDDCANIGLGLRCSQSSVPDGLLALC